VGVTGGRFQVGARCFGRRPASVYYVDQFIPKYFEMSATIRAVNRPRVSTQIPIDLRLSESDGLQVCGHQRLDEQAGDGASTATGWVVDKQASIPATLKSDTDYSVFLSVNGLVATLIVNNQTTLSWPSSC